MHKQQIFNQQVEVVLADAACVKVEIMGEQTAHLADAALGGITLPLTYFLAVQRLTDNSYIGSNQRANIIAGIHLYLLTRHDDSHLGMVGANYAHGLRPAHSICNYVTGCLFFDASVASGATKARLPNLFIV